MSAPKKEKNEDQFDDLPSLFSAELSKDVKIFTIKLRNQLKLVMKRVGRELRSNSSVIVRGMDDQIDRCIACTEMTKNWLAERPVIKDSDCTNVYQWNKIGQIKVRSENKLELDSYVPILEILLSCRPFAEDQPNDSIQQSTAVETAPSVFKREDDSLKFPEMKLQKIEQIGDKNPDNIFRRKRKLQ